MSKSLYDVTNKIKFSFSIVVASLTLLTLDLILSEAVPNAEQIDLITKLTAFGEGLVAQNSANAAPGSLFDPAGHATVAFQVLDSDGNVLLSESVVFDPSVPNAQQAAVLSALAGFGQNLVASAPAAPAA